MRARGGAGRRPYRPSFRRRGRPAWRRLFPALFAFVVLLLAPALVHAQGAAQDSVLLSWTATGDDSLFGTATQYDLRVAPAPITEASWDSATSVAGLPAPTAPGTTQQVRVRGLSAGTAYYFALKVRDDAGNWSGVSNVVRWDGLEAAPPAAPTGLAVARSGAGAHLTWDPSADPGLTGYNVYRAVDPAGPWTKLNPAQLPTASYQDDALPAGAASLYYQATACNSGGESARSAGVKLSLSAQGPQVAAWAIQTGYPNPSHLADPVRIPVDLVDPGVARLDILDAGERLVRRLDLGSLGAGHFEVSWDGRNDAGRTVAPGAYRVWLDAGDTRRSTRIVRVP